ncbi:hypothetical protein CEXT_266441 [Caerostris extrusa]|uniref:Uncharacterized protein n=1 Tax=Caerostris extrusa TaxID=172846 RepID=A0AAV4S602_CAEEX|nr:hypothetical protein CEXT_266441 [Caerostris extrusa]
MLRCRVSCALSSLTKSRILGDFMTLSLLLSEIPKTWHHQISDEINFLLENLKKKSNVNHNLVGPDELTLGNSVKPSASHNLVRFYGLTLGNSWKLDAIGLLVSGGRKEYKRPMKM